ncbi:MAG: hypothetical protein ACYC9Y_06205 [Candidatus Methylomirabilia bacterium]
MKCSNCRHYQKRSDYEDRGWCRRYPPTPVAKKFGEFPLVGEKGRCGEFQPAVEAQARMHD